MTTAAKSSQQSNIIGVLALVAGVLSFTGGILPIIGLLIGLVSAFAAITLGILGIVRKSGFGMAVTGLVLGTVSLLLTAAVFVMYVVIPFSFGETDASLIEIGSADAQTKNDASRLAAAIYGYQANHAGSLPSASMVKSDQFRRDYKMENMHIPIEINGQSQKGSLLYKPGEACDGKRGPRAFSVHTLLTNGDDYCAE